MTIADGMLDIDLFNSLLATICKFGTKKRNHDGYKYFYKILVSNCYNEDNNAIVLYDVYKVAMNETDNNKALLTELLSIIMFEYTHYINY